jgi:hypothetical protein
MQACKGREELLARTELISCTVSVACWFVIISSVCVCVWNSPHSLMQDAVTFDAILLFQKIDV